MSETYLFPSLGLYLFFCATGSLCYMFMYFQMCGKLKSKPIKRAIQLVLQAFWWRR